MAWTARRRQRTGPEARFCFARDWEIAANWKTSIEIALESYHVEMVHSSTFASTPDAETCFHEFGDQWHCFETQNSIRTTGVKARIRNAIKSAIGLPHQDTYRQWLRHPSVEVVETGPITFVTQVRPIAPGRCQKTLRMYCNTGNRKSIMRRLAAPLIDRRFRHLIDQVMDEDGSVLPSVQKGLESPLQPLGAGLISIREERIFHFQRAILSAVGADANSEAGTDGKTATPKSPAKAA